MYSCDVCMPNKQFSTNANLRRHQRSVHATEGQGLKCQYCDKKFFRPDHIVKHMIGVHKKSIDLKKKTDKKFKCHLCNKSFGLRKNLLRHVRSLHDSTDMFKKPDSNPEPHHLREEISGSDNLTRPVNESETEKFKCEHCLQNYMSKKSLNKHLKLKHTQTMQEVASSLTVANAKLACAVCDFRGHSYVTLTRHLTQFHNYDHQIKYNDFESLSEFKSWKKCVESEQLVKYVKGRGMRQGVKAKKILFQCYRSGVCKRKGNGIRKLKKTCKVGAVCPARMDVCLQDNGSVSLTWHINHFGHDFDENLSKLTATERGVCDPKLKNDLDCHNDNNDNDDISDGNDYCNLEADGDVQEWNPLCDNLKTCLEQLRVVDVSAEVVDQGLKFLQLLQKELLRSSPGVCFSSLPTDINGNT